MEKDFDDKYKELQKEITTFKKEKEAKIQMLKKNERDLQEKLTQERLKIKQPDIAKAMKQMETEIDTEVRGNEPFRDETSTYEAAKGDSQY